MILKTSKTTTFYQSISSGKPLVLLHGWGCDWQIWSNQIRELSKKYKLIIPDLPGFGKSEILDKKVWNSADYAEWLDEFLSLLKILELPYALAGHSFGGKISALYESKHNNQNLKMLILIDSAGLPNELEYSHKFVSSLIEKTPKAFKKLVNTNLKKKILSNLNLSTDHLFSNDIQKKILEKVVNENISKVLQEISKPTLVIWGKNDLDTPLDQGRMFNKLIAESHLKIFDQSGHFPFIDESNEFNTLVTTELEKYL